MFVGTEHHLPVEVEGALFSVGDAHAAQGGEPLPLPRWRGTNTALEPSNRAVHRDLSGLE